MKHYHVLCRDHVLSHCNTSWINHIWRIILVGKWLLTIWLVRPVKIYIVVNGGCNPLGSPLTKRGCRPSMSSKHILQKIMITSDPTKLQVRAKTICPTQKCSIGWEGICCVPGKYANQSPKALLWLSAYRGCTTTTHVLCRDYFLSHCFRPLS